MKTDSNRRIIQYTQIVKIQAAKVKGINTELLDSVTDFYGDDFSSNILSAQLDVFKHNFQYSGPKDQIGIEDIVKYLQSLTSAQRLLVSQVYKLTQIVLVMPATNAVSERAFSGLRRIKTYLRSTMNQDRLNSIMVLHVHKEYTDDMDLVDIANEFVHSSDHRYNMFGKFTVIDTAASFSFGKSRSTQTLLI